MVKEEDLILTRHAQDKMILEGVSIKQVAEAITRGSVFKQTDGFLAVYTYFSVAYKKIGDNYKIKTVFINK
ncbi:hypothetical protein J4230_02400 [Candidatus Woesearchaeota archaeon]|nr:hypothetical protein [Candidatus Woesearchaeota archaeon]